jgi:hypothetical protein
MAGWTVNHEACPAAGFAGEMLNAGRRMPDVNAMAVDPTWRFDLIRLGGQVWRSGLAADLAA